MPKQAAGPFITACVLLLAAFAQAPCVAAMASEETPGGFDPIFNGKDLEGWYGGETREPGFLENAGEPEWGKYRIQKYREVAKHWRVEDGELIGRGAGPDLVTWGEYGDFELQLEWKVSPNSESGISIRGLPGITLWDASGDALRERGAGKGSGGLTDTKGQGLPPAERADQPAGQWNRMIVRMAGPYVTVTLNGKKVLDNAQLPNAYHPDRPIEPAGHLHLRTRSGEVRFRNIVIRELTAEASNKVLAGLEAEEGYQPLFNETDFTGWTGNTQAYERIAGGVRSKAGHHAIITTQKQYRDFSLRFEFKVPPGGNNGLLIRAPAPNKPGLELQVLDNPHKMFRKLKDTQYHGSAYGISPARRGYLRPTGQWNCQTVTIKADHVRVVLNGYEILDTRLKKAAPNNPNAKREQGHFGFASHWDPVSFRYMRIKEHQ